ncbi:MAG: ATP-dependent DNA helicase PcrA [Acidobacteria bacterium CG_4_9_14_3_um_filter_49_7]|nr:MAG: ATP-dependent DNA helicase PcrA [Acidobacteria bacterium CG_4_9_14_3_um_filter_49_7]
MDMPSQLNESQREAIACTKGPLLVVAGAGSGKTKVITCKIAHLIRQEFVPEHHILAVTFTNKAAGEMRRRAMAMLDRAHLSTTISTFHSLCLRILRKEAVILGYGSDFSVCDSADALSLIKRIISESGRKNQKEYAPKKIQALISAIKNDSGSERKLEPVPAIDQILDQYDATLRENELMDFDDLLLNTVTIFEQNPSVLSHYQSQFPYILVDEFQDTNATQYRLIRLLSASAIHICAVGDEDQSIYGWRGADFENILNFPQDFEDCRVIKLEENYRSTQQILDIANAVISHNSMRNPKVLRSDIRTDGDYTLYEAPAPQEEGMFIAKQVQALLQQKISLNNIAVLYRANYLSRTLEDAFRRRNIPYRIVGGYKFYDRKEIKDILGYLRVIRNPSDNVSFQRIINVPRRKIGPATVEKLESIHPVLFKALENLPDRFPRKAELDELHNIIETFRKREDFGPEFLRDLIERIGYIEMLKAEENSLEAETRMENLSELLTVVGDYLAAEENPSFNGFLDTISLLSDTDELEDDDRVNLMTIHCAKGLEFHSVFVCGLEEGTFPNQRTMGSSRELEEERRLMYVAITRAKHNLYLSFSRERGWKWEMNRKQMSRFVREIPVELLTMNRPATSAAHSRLLNAAHSGGLSTSESSKNNGDSSFSIHKGSTVTHHTYGEGTVLNLVNGDRMVVKFKRSGIKVLSSKVIQLRKD